MNRGPPQATPVAPGRRLRRIRDALLAALLGAAAALLGTELLVRWCVFHPEVELGGLGAWLRSAERYGDPDEDDYWKLRARFDPESRARGDAAHPDPLTGWTGPFVTPGSYAHKDEPLLGERRPVLMYGDSFTQCATPAEQCFQGLLERSDLGATHALLNYGTGGYGLDQIYLLMRATLDRHAARAPVVVVALLLEDDLDRSVLGFRTWPKPRLEVVAGELVWRGSVETRVDAYLAEHPVAFRSYAWRLFLCLRSPVLAQQRERWRGRPRMQAEKQALCRALLEAIEHELSSRDLEHFFLLFHVENGVLQPLARCAWQERLLADFCAERGVPLIDTRDHFAFAADGRAERCARYYGRGFPRHGHHSPLGNLVCFEALRQGLLGRSELDVERLARLKASGVLDGTAEERSSVRVLERQASVVTHGSLGAPRVGENELLRRLVLRADATGTTSLTFELSGGAARFTGSLREAADEAGSCPGAPLVLRVEVDGQCVLECPVPGADAPRPLDVDLADRRTLSLIVSGVRGGGGCDWICIQDPRLD